MRHGCPILLSPVHHHAFALQAAGADMKEAASQLQAMDAEQEVARGIARGTLPPNDKAEAIVRQLHDSGVGRILFAKELGDYVKAGPTERADMLLGVPYT